MKLAIIGPANNPKKQLGEIRNVYCFSSSNGDSVLFPEYFIIGFKLTLFPEINKCPNIIWSIRNIQMVIQIKSFFLNNNSSHTSILTED